MTSSGASPGSRVAVALALLVLTGTAGPAGADTPTPANFTACNLEAHEAVKAGTAAPIARDHRRAEEARKALGAADAKSAARMEDPQLVGMAGDRAGEPAYQAAYRTCMRRSGF